MTTTSRTNTCRDCNQLFDLKPNESKITAPLCPECVEAKTAALLEESRRQERNDAILAAAIEEDANTIYVDGYANEATRRYLIEIGYYPKGFRITQKETARGR